MSGKAAPSRTQRGRPRDPEVENRIAAAALAIYGEQGWAGFNFETVARAAEVSRDSLYRRWSDRRQLLVHAIGRLGRPDAPPADEVDLRTELRRMAILSLRRYLAPGGLALLRLYVEAAQDPELLALFQKEVVAPAVQHARQTVRDAVAAGRLRPDTSATALIDAIFGAVLIHILVTPVELRPRMLERAEDHLTKVVDLTLRGAGYPLG
jgi:AcrR family transcriptional regulator